MPRYRTSAWRNFDPRATAAARSPVKVDSAACVRIIGLDPGSRRTGFGVIECRGVDCKHIAHGCIAVAGLALAERLRRIFESLQGLFAEHGPAEVAVERVFVSRNADSALKLGQARGAALCAIPQGIPVFEYAPRTIKLALVGSGAAEKFQVGHMIRALLQLEGRIAADASDALAIAVCHAHSRRMQLLTAEGEAQWGRTA